MSFRSYAMVKGRALDLLQAGEPLSIPKAVDQAAAEWRAKRGTIGNAELARIKRELKARFEPVRSVK